LRCRLTVTARSFTSQATATNPSNEKADLQPLPKPTVSDRTSWGRVTLNLAFVEDAPAEDPRGRGTTGLSNTVAPSYLDKVKDKVDVDPIIITIFVPLSAFKQHHQRSSKVR
jgi:hypothetical protein